MIMKRSEAISICIHFWLEIEQWTKFQCTRWITLERMDASNFLDPLKTYSELYFGIVFIIDGLSYHLNELLKASSVAFVRQLEIDFIIIIESISSCNNYSGNILLWLSIDELVLKSTQTDYTKTTFCEKTNYMNVIKLGLSEYTTANGRFSAKA